MLQQALAADALRGDEATERILDAALAAFVDFGLRRTTMEDIAGRLGISRVTIYRRFSSKEALIDAVLMREAQRFFQDLDGAVARYESTDERLAEGFAFTLDFLRGHALLNRILTTEPEALLPHLTVEAAPILAAARGFVAERLGREVEQGRLPPLDAEIAAELLVRLVLSFLLTPESSATLDGHGQARRFARRYLAPALHVTAGAKRG